MDEALRREVMRMAAELERPPEDAALPPGTTDAEMDAFEARTGVTVPPELREWLRFTNGPLVGPGGVYGIRTGRDFPDTEAVYGSVPEFRERGWIPVSGDGCGCYYVLVTRSADAVRPVYFIDPYQDGGYGVPTYAVASGLWRFLWFLFRSELGDRSWPFDRAAVLVADPELAGVRGARLPWEA